MPRAGKNRAGKAQTRTPRIEKEAGSPEAVLAATPKEHQETRISQGTGISRGTGIIQRALATAPDGPGVYRMLDAKGAVIYVGKAKNLKKRLASYSRISGHTRRIQRMISQIDRLEMTTTATEAEALLLEGVLIKRLKPLFNILLRDDKSFPYIMITSDHAWPRIRKHRGKRQAPGSYYGPFAASGIVHTTLVTIERAFLLRSCSDNEFASRRRPCLLYQIKRCSAPCVGRIKPAAYARLVGEAQDFLKGRDGSLVDSLTRRMQEASKNEDYETALAYRDRIRALSRLRDFKGATMPGMGDVDVIAVHADGGQSCVEVFFFRSGRHYGNRAYFPRHDQAAGPAAILSAFIGQFYAARPAPRSILLSHPIAEKELIEEALTSRSGHRVRLQTPRRGVRKDAIDRALDNAREALARKRAESNASAELLGQFALRFGLNGPPERIEVYDNSHIRGQQSLGAMIVAGPEGFRREAYRKFNARRTLDKPGDDYALLREVLERRLSRLLRENPTRTGKDWPDLLLIDGGPGHLSVVREVLAAHDLDAMATIAIAKGPQRHAGRERFYTGTSKPMILDPRDPVLHYAQRLRDEAHRFAIAGHRARREAKTRRSHT